MSTALTSSVNFAKFVAKNKNYILTVTAAFLGACALVNSRSLLISGENPLNIAVWIGLVACIPWLLIFWRRRSEFVSLLPRYKWMLFGIGVASSVGIQYLQVLALAHTTAANFAFLYRTVTVFTIIFAAIFLKEKITVSKWVLAALIVVGSYFLLYEDGKLLLSLGALYTLAMAAAAALIANVLIKHTISKMHPDLSGAVVQVVATTALLSMAWATQVLEMPINWGMVLVGGLLAFAQIILRNRAYAVASASYVSMIYALSPLFVTVLSYLFLQEKLSWLELAGGAIIIGSTVVAHKLRI